jgi:hypothetical protein
VERDSRAGAGALAWRFFDFGLLAVIWAAMAVIARRVDWLAGFLCRRDVCPDPLSRWTDAHRAARPDADGDAAAGVRAAS